MGASTSELGDVVRMRSGGPAMTVTAVKGGSNPAEVCCMWFESRGRPHYYFLPVAALEPAEPETELASTKRRS